MLTELDARPRHRPPARPAEHRQRQPRHLGAAAPVGRQPGADPRRRRRRDELIAEMGTGLARHRADRRLDQPDDRRLLARRQRLLGRERRDRPAGQRMHDRRQPARDARRRSARPTTPGPGSAGWCRACSSRAWSLPEADRAPARGGGAGGRRDRARLRRPRRTRCARSPAAHGPVSEADLAVDRHAARDADRARARTTAGCRRRARTARRRLDAPRVFVVDPIDGTRAFLAGQKAWAHVARRRRGRPGGRRASCTCPRSGSTYAAAAGEGAHARRRADRVGRRRRSRRRRGCSPTGSALDPGSGPAAPPPVERHFRPVARLPALPRRRGPLRRDLQLPRHLGMGRRRRRPDRPRGRRGGHDPRRRRPGLQPPDPRLPGILVCAPALHAALLARV